MPDFDRLKTHTHVLLKGLSALFKEISEAYAKETPTDASTIQEYCLLLALAQVVAATSLQQNVEANLQAPPIEKMMMQAKMLEQATVIYDGIVKAGVMRSRGTVAGTGETIDTTLVTMPMAGSA